MPVRRLSKVGTSAIQPVQEAVTLFLPCILCQAPLVWDEQTGRIRECLSAVCQNFFLYTVDMDLTA